MSVLPSGDGLRARGLVSNETEAAALTQDLAAALLRPVAASELPSVRRKLAMLARRPLADAALEAASKCDASLFAPPGTHGGASGSPDSSTDAERDRPAIELETLETWRKGAIGLGRVSIGTAGRESLGDAVASALAKGPEWPSAAAIAREPPPRGTRAPTTQPGTWPRAGRA